MWIKNLGEMVCLCNNCNRIFDNSTQAKIIVGGDYSQGHFCSEVCYTNYYRETLAFTDEQMHKVETLTVRH